MLPGIRHPEELSLARRLERDELKRNQGVSATRRSRPAGLRSSTSGSEGRGHHHMSNASLMVDGGSAGVGSTYLAGTSPHRYAPLRTTPRVNSLLRLFVV